MRGIIPEVDARSGRAGYRCLAPNAWDLDKNWKKHGVTFWECEEIFLNHPLAVSADARHSGNERRYYALGWTEARRLLFVAFTIRKMLIRAISVRDMTAKERRAYEFYTKKDS